jgi:pilus assembly protein CpaB
MFRDGRYCVGQTINRTLERGEPFMYSYFRRPVERLQARLESDERAVTLRVDAITGVAGNLVPGSHVDIIGTFPLTPQTGGKAPAAGTAGSHTMLLLADVTVLAVDNRLREAQYYVSSRGSSRGAAYSSVTVSVTPKEANILVYAQDYGVLTMALRPPAAKPTVPLPPEITEKNLLKEAAQAEKEREERLKQRPSPVP